MRGNLNDNYLEASPSPIFLSLKLTTDLNNFLFDEYDGEPGVIKDHFEI